MREVNDVLAIDTSGVVPPEFESPDPAWATGLLEPPLIDSDDEFVTATRRLIEYRAYES